MNIKKNTIKDEKHKEKMEVPAAAALVPEGNPSQSSLPGSSKCAWLHSEEQ